MGKDINLIVPQKLLIIRPDAIGDVVLMIPMIQRLKHVFPQVSITVMMQAYTEPLLRHHPDVDAIIFDPRKCKNAANDSFFTSVKKLKNHDFDTVVFSYMDDYTAALCWAAGIPNRIGDGNRWPLKWLLTHPVNQSFRDLMSHEVEQNFSLLQPFGFKWNEEAFCKDIDIAKLGNALDHPEMQVEGQHRIANFPEKKYMIIHPSSGGGNRAWLPEKYAACIQILIEKGYDIVITGAGKKEEIIAKNILDRLSKQASQNVKNVVGKTNIYELSHLIQSAACVVGTDTGPTHIAAALGVPVVSVSPTKFVKALRWGPWLTASTIVSESQICKLACKPYKCQLTDCLEAISADQLAAAILNLCRKDAVKLPKLSVQKLDWLKHSGKILLYQVDRKNSISQKSMSQKNSVDQKSNRATSASDFGEEVMSTKEYLESLGFQVVVKAHKKQSIMNIMRLRKFIIEQDIVVIHTFGIKLAWYWRLMLQLSALSVYCPPAIYTHKASFEKTIDGLFEAYRQAFKT